MPGTNPGRWTGPTRSTGRGALYLLLTASAAAGVLGVAAVVATAAYRAAVERSLNRYADIAAWQLTERTGEALEEALELTLWPVRQFGTVGDDGFPPVTVFAGFTPEAEDCPCPLPLAARFYFRLDLRTDVLDTSGEPLDPHQAVALREALRGPGDRRSGTLTVAPWSDGTLFLALTVLPDREGTPAAVYGAAIPPSAVAPVLSQALGDAVLLPTSVVSLAEQEEMFLVSVLEGAGRTLFGSGAGAPSAFRAESALGDDLGGLRIELLLSQRATAALAPGAATPPWILGSLLVGALALLGAAFRSLATERRLLETRERFVTALSHDLRTPLAQIRLYAETLRLGRTRSEEERGAYLEFVDVEARRLGHAIENALMVGRGPGPMPPPEPVDVAALAREEADRFACLAPGATLRVLGPDAAWASARADPLRRILANLIDNAVKYGPAGQTVDVVVKEDERRVRLRIVDRGPGIDREARGRVFEPFVRLRGSRTTTGSGVGLAVVRDLVTALGGSVRIEDAEPTGTALVVELERAEKPDPAGTRGGRP
ncbi:MAG: HAMP domain-containing sensor histidine kinase [Gemmatimonadota bacterium]